MSTVMDHIVIEDQMGRPCLHLRGEVTIYDAAFLRQAAMELIARGEEVEVCCARTTYLDTAALQVLLALKRELEARGLGLRLVQIPSAVLEVLRLVGLIAWLPGPS
jgi:anti-anti-sigma factor